MIEIINENILRSGADIIINPVDCNGNNCSSVWNFSNDEMPWVETECRKYVRKHNKEHNIILGTVQFVPTEVWAIGLIDTMAINNQIVPCGKDFAYIANIFICHDIGSYEVEPTLDSMGAVYERVCQNGIKSIAIPEDFIEHTSVEFCEELIAKWSAANIEVKFYKVI